MGMLEGSFAVDGVLGIGNNHINSTVIDKMTPYFDEPVFTIGLKKVPLENRRGYHTNDVGFISFGTTKNDFAKVQSTIRERCPLTFRGKLQLMVILSGKLWSIAYKLFICFSNKRVL